MSNGGKDYIVGYRRPPKHGQFKKGQSGNPSGRRKPTKTKTLADTLFEELRQEITVHEKGRSYKMTRQQALIRQAVNQALQGDIRPLKLLQTIMPIVDSSLKATEAKHRESAEASDSLTNKLNEMARRFQAQSGEN